MSNHVLPVDYRTLSRWHLIFLSILVAEGHHIPMILVVEGQQKMPASGKSHMHSLQSCCQCGSKEQGPPKGAGKGSDVPWVTAQHTHEMPVLLQSTTHAPVLPGHVRFAVPMQWMCAHSFLACLRCLRCQGNASQLKVTEQRAP